MKAKTKAEYKEAWREHCAELANLAIAAGVGWKEYNDVRFKLEEWTDKAADKVFSTKTHHVETLRALKVDEELEVHTEDDWCAFCEVRVMHDRCFHFDAPNYVIKRTL